MTTNAERHMHEYKNNQTNTIKENLNDGNNLEIMPERPMKHPVNPKKRGYFWKIINQTH